MDDKFQTAFPEDTEPKLEEALCRYGCGQTGNYFGAGPGGGELPRCSLQMSDCPKIGKAAIRAAKKAGELGRRWKSRF